MYVKIHETGQDQSHKNVIAVCDEHLIGKTFTEENKTITVSEKFYKGEKKTEKETIEILKTATNVNLVGEQSVNAGMKAGVITEENIIKIQGVPHAQAFTFT